MRLPTPAPSSSNTAISSPARPLGPEVVPGQRRRQFPGRPADAGMAAVQGHRPDYVADSHVLALQLAVIPTVFRDCRRTGADAAATELDQHLFPLKQRAGRGVDHQQVGADVGRCGGDRGRIEPQRRRGRPDAGSPGTAPPPSASTPRRRACSAWPPRRPSGRSRRSSNPFFAARRQRPRRPARRPAARNRTVCQATTNSSRNCPAAAIPVGEVRARATSRRRSSSRTEGVTIAWGETTTRRTPSSRPATSASVISRASRLNSPCRPPRGERSRAGAVARRRRPAPAPLLPRRGQPREHLADHPFDFDGRRHHLSTIPSTVQRTGEFCCATFPSLQCRRW